VAVRLFPHVTVFANCTQSTQFGCDAVAKVETSAVAQLTGSKAGPPTWTRAVRRRDGWRE